MSQLFLNQRLKINYRGKHYKPNFHFMSESILESKSFLLKNIQTYQNQFYTSIISFDSVKSGTKHTLIWTWNFKVETHNTNHKKLNKKLYQESSKNGLNPNSSPFLPDEDEIFRWSSNNNSHSSSSSSH
jgi:hypothetical protein